MRLAKPMYPCHGVLAIKLKMKRMLLLAVLMNYHPPGDEKRNEKTKHAVGILPMTIKEKERAKKLSCPCRRE
eukprot:1158836-Pelagomonas_calceolata.AAC.12